MSSHNSAKLGNTGSFSDITTTTLKDFTGNFKKGYDEPGYSYQFSRIATANIWNNQGGTGQQTESGLEANTFTSPESVKHKSNLLVLVNGKITDANGAPVVGVTVTEKGTTNATTTDNEGNFSLNVTDGTASLILTSVGYNTQEIAVANRTSISVQLQCIPPTNPY